MPKKSTKKTEKTVREIAVEAALLLAADMPWNTISLNNIAEAGKLDLATLRACFEDRTDILCAFGRMIDQKVLKNVSTAADTPARDRLFDLLMERFDILNENREGILSILHSFKCDPKQAIIGMPYLARSMGWMLETASIDTSGIKGALRVAGLTALYLKTLYVWLDDESPDMAKTMAALDKNLGHAESFAERFGL